MARRAASKDFELRGKTALVTGGGIRLGRAIALALAERGCDIVLHYLSSKKQAIATAREIERIGRRTKLLRSDLSNPAAAKKLAQDAERFAPIDILINSAAIFWPTPLERQTAAELDSFLNTNLKGPYVLCAELGKKMKRRGSGAVVNLACLSGFRAWKNFVPYSISKAGVIAMTVGMAKLLAPEVRVNAVAPGTVLPPDSMSKSELEALRKRLPLQRLGSQDDIVSAVLYLLSATFVTGEVLRVDGGRSLV